MTDRRSGTRFALAVLALAACACCHSGEPQVAPVAASPPAKVAGGAISPTKVSSKGNIGPHRFKVDCTADAGGAVTVAPDATTVTCKDSSAGVEITLRIVAPKVGIMDASPNKGASLITFNAGELGHCDNTDGRCNTLLVITEWGESPGHHVGNFGMNWHDSDKPPRLEGNLEGSFSF
jgi:hypothetical protein